MYQKFQVGDRVVMNSQYNGASCLIGWKGVVTGKVGGDFYLHKQGYFSVQWENGTHGGAYGVALDFIAAITPYTVGTFVRVNSNTDNASIRGMEGQVISYTNSNGDIHYTCRLGNQTYPNIRHTSLTVISPVNPNNMPTKVLLPVGTTVTINNSCSLRSRRGQVGVILAHTYGATDDYQLQMPGNKTVKVLHSSVDYTPATTPATTVHQYVEGTEGQLSGFRADWQKLGFPAQPGPLQYRSLVLTFTPGAAPKIGIYTGTDFRAIPVVPNWEALLQRAKAHNEDTTKAPFKIAGHDVVYKDDKLTIGCRRDITRADIISLDAVIKAGNAHNARVTAIKLADAELSVAEISKLADWLRTK